MAVLTDERLSRADLAWLHAEAPTNHFVVTSLLLLDAPLDVERFKAMLAGRISLHPRLRQTVSESSLPMVPARWVPAARFDLDAHIHRVSLPRSAGIAELEAFIDDLAGRPLDFGRPLWELYVVEGPGKGGAVVTRFHHSLGDGHAMVRMLFTLTDETASGWKRPLPRSRRAPRRRKAHGQSALQRLIGQVPAGPRYVRQAVEGAGALARLTLLDPDCPTPLRGELTMLKSVAWTAGMPLLTVKRIARASGTTVNDVVVSAIAGGLGSYLRDVGIETRGLRIRAMVPVDLRAGDDPSMTGNQFSLVYLEMPVGVTGSWERLMRVKIEMDRIKKSQEPAVGWLLVQGLGLLPAALERLASTFYAGKATLVLTNVIGPRRPIYIAGTRVSQMTFWEPESGGLGLGVSIYSYAGRITVGVISDRNLVARPQAITAAVTRAFEDLAQETS